MVRSSGFPAAGSGALTGRYPMRVTRTLAAPAVARDREASVGASDRAGGRRPRGVQHRDDSAAEAGLRWAVTNDPPQLRLGYRRNHDRQDADQPTTRAHRIIHGWVDASSLGTHPPRGTCPGLRFRESEVRARCLCGERGSPRPAQRLDRLATRLESRPSARGGLDLGASSRPGQRPTLLKHLAPLAPGGLMRALRFTSVTLSLLSVSLAPLTAQQRPAESRAARAIPRLGRSLESPALTRRHADPLRPAVGGQDERPLGVVHLADGRGRHAPAPARAGRRRALVARRQAHRVHRQG